MRHKVLVLMSTYNGEKYLREQLDSILSQEGVDLNILIRDDGSQDETIKILNEYSQKYDILKWYRGDNIGFIGSFSELVKNAVTESKFNYFAFADQDDIWYPRKIEKACNALSRFDEGNPNLYTCNSVIVDVKCNHIRLFHKDEKHNYGRGSVLLYSTEQGCSMVFNRKAAELYAENAPMLSWHDRWMQLICSYFGHTYYDNTPMFNYRVHGGNALASSKRKIKLTFMKVLRPNSYTSTFQIMAKEFYDVFGEKLSHEDREIIECYITYKKSLKSRLNVIFSSHFRCPTQSVREKLTFALKKIWGIV